MLIKGCCLTIQKLIGLDLHFHWKSFSSITGYYLPWLCLISGGLFRNRTAEGWNPYLQP